MSAPDVPDVAVEIVRDELAGLGYGPDLPSDFYAALAALAAAGWLRDPVEVAALRAVADAAQKARQDGTLRCPADVRSALYAALDAVRPESDAAREGQS